MKILVMGLPGSGKTFLARELKKRLVTLDKTVEWLNADEIRKNFNDWDFSREGRLRQAERMKALAADSCADFVICDFVAPLPEMRDIFSADWTIWVDTIESGRFEDTNKVFTPPEEYDFRIRQKNAKHYSKQIINEILPAAHEKWWRSLFKAVSYRMCGTITTVVITFFVTGQIIIAASVGLIEMCVKPFIYWCHERVWNKIRLGKN